MVALEGFGACSLILELACPTIEIAVLRILEIDAFLDAVRAGHASHQPPGVVIARLRVLPRSSAIRAGLNRIAGRPEIGSLLLAAGDCSHAHAFAEEIVRALALSRLQGWVTVVGEASLLEALEMSLAQTVEVALFHPISIISGVAWLWMGNWAGNVQDRAQSLLICAYFVDCKDALRCISRNAAVLVCAFFKCIKFLPRNAKYASSTGIRANGL